LSVPTTDNTEIFLGGSGIESIPQNIIVKGSTWFLYKAIGRLYMREYGGSYIYRFNFVVNKFIISQAINPSRLYYTDRFWLWYTDVSSNLTLLEVEPFSGAVPVIHVTKSISSNILNMSIYVEENKPIRVLTLYSY
jgi:hypothetical protein